MPKSKLSEKLILERDDFEKSFDFDKASEDEKHQFGRTIQSYERAIERCLTNEE